MPTEPEEPPAPVWPPDLIGLDTCGGDWARYCDFIYGRFHNDLIVNCCRFQGKRVSVNRRRVVRSKEAVFWHCISEGDAEEDRLPDLRRCERIGWIRRMLEAVGTPKVVWWRESHGRARRTHVALADFTHIVVLEELTTHCALITAFPVEMPHRQRGYRARHQRATEKG